MSRVDLIIIVFTAVLAVIGYLQGALSGAVTLVGVGMGAFVAWHVAPTLLSDPAAEKWLPLALLVGTVSFATLFSTILHDVTGRMRHRHYVLDDHPFDRGGGVVVACVVALVTVWAGAAVVMANPAGRQMSPFILDSALLQTMNQVLPPASALDVFTPRDPVRELDGPKITAAPLADHLPSKRSIRTAADSVVRVVGTACGYGVTGSGWIAAPGTVVTNAHVVAGEHDTAVVLRGESRQRAAKVIYYNPTVDIAVLDVGEVGRPPLGMAAQVATGADAAVLGFPEKGPFTFSSATIGKSTEVRTQDSYGKRLVDRTILDFRGKVRHGNSGGPVVDSAGKVVATVFATSVGNGPAGGYAIPNSVVEKSLKSTSEDASTGDCS